MDQRGRVSAYYAKYMLLVQPECAVTRYDIQTNISQRVLAINATKQVAVKPDSEADNIFMMLIRLSPKPVLHPHYEAVSQILPTVTDGVLFHWVGIDGGEGKFLGQNNALGLPLFQEKIRGLTVFSNNTVNTAPPVALDTTPIAVSSSAAGAGDDFTDDVFPGLRFNGFVVRIKYMVDPPGSKPLSFYKSSRETWCKQIQLRLMGIHGTQRAAVLAVGPMPKQPEDDMRIFFAYIEIAERANVNDYVTCYERFTLLTQKKLEKEELVPHGWGLAVQPVHKRLIATVYDIDNIILWPVAQNVVMPFRAGYGEGSVTTENRHMKEFMLEQSAAPFSLAISDAKKDPCYENKYNVARWSYNVATLMEKPDDIDILAGAFERFKMSGETPLTEEEREMLKETAAAAAENEATMFKEGKEASDRLKNMAQGIKFQKAQYLDLEKLWDHYYHKNKELEHKLCNEFPELQKMREKISRIRREREDEADFILGNEGNKLFGLQATEFIGYAFRKAAANENNLSFRNVKIEAKRAGFDIVKI